MENRDDKTYIQELVARARRAQAEAEHFSQEKVDTLSRALGWAMVKESNIKEIAELCVKETRMGTYEAKLAKLNKKVRGVLSDINPLKTVGVVEELPELGIRRLAKPVGVVGSLIPTTQPEMCPATQAMLAVKGRNAIIFSPHPRSKKTTYRVVEILRETLKKYGAPEDLLICCENPTIPMSRELMAQCDLVLATGGAGMVKSAYSSGTPAYGVGVGNAIVVVDETADLKAAARNIRLSKTFDHSSGCSCENSIVVQESIYDEFMECLKEEGAYLADERQKEQLEKAIWPDGHTINRDIVTQPTERIAELAGFKVPASCTFIMVEESGTGADHLFAGEKLCLVLAVYKYTTFDDAVRIVNENHAYQGAGHSCGIQSTNEEHILQIALETKTTRVMVNQAQSSANSGDWNNGMPFTGSLGCGTWGGNVVSENITMKHFLNNTWLSVPIEGRIPEDEELFGSDIMQG